MDYDLKSLTARIEPILIGIVAVMVLVLALGIFTPMWDMMRSGARSVGGIFTPPGGGVMRAVRGQ